MKNPILKYKKWFTIGIALLLVLALAVGCSQGTGKQDQGAKDSSGGNGASGGSQTLEIGYVGGLSGPTAAFGLPIFEAVEYATKEINAQGGINGMQIKIVKIDDEGNPFQGQQAIEKFDNQGIKVVVSGSSSAVALSQVPKVRESEIVTISPVASDPGVPAEGSYFFVNMTNNNDYGYALAYYADQMGAKEVITFVRDDAYGQSIQQAFKEKTDELGISIAREIVYAIDTNDFNSYISQALSDFPDAYIVLTGYAADSGLIAKQARALGYDKTFFATNPISNPQYQEVAGIASDNTIIASAYFAKKDGASEYATQFLNDWSHSKGLLPNVYQVHGYDAVYMLKQAIEEAGGIDPKVIREKLAAIENYDGVTGNMAFNSDGSVTKAMFMVKWEGGELELIEELQAETYTLR